MKKKLSQLPDLNTATPEECRILLKVLEILRRGGPDADRLRDLVDRYMAERGLRENAR
jgi:hypothetical protein